MKKAIGIFAALLIALAMSGVAFAHWSQTLYIEGTINTGMLCVGLRDTGVNDPGNDPGFDTDLDVQVYYDKDVASITSTNVDPKCTHDGITYFHKEVITITNAYPSYAPGWTTKIANCGTIPVKISGFVLTPAIDDWPCWIELLKWDKFEDGVWVANGASHPIPGYTNYGDTCYDELINKLSLEQLDPCHTISVYIELHTTQEFCPMPMNATWTFDVEVTFTQWNLVP